MSRPIIAVTAGRQNPHTVQREVQTVTVGVDLDYLEVVQQAGGAPVVLPSVAEESAVRAILQHVDGVLLSGGGDVLSLAYGEDPHPAGSMQDAGRDAMEFAVTRAARAMGLPILGICRGLQVLNVAHGGTLVQDVPTQVPGAMQHFSAGLDVLLLHTIDIDPDSLLARVTGRTSMAVNSWHHQAVKTVGDGLRVNARARDGVIEGVEAADGAPVLGIQCHPEECVACHPEFLSFFTWLVAEAEACRLRPRTPAMPPSPLTKAGNTEAPSVA